MADLYTLTGNSRMPIHEPILIDSVRYSYFGAVVMVNVFNFLIRDETNNLEKSSVLLFRHSMSRRYPNSLTEMTVVIFFLPLIFYSAFWALVLQASKSIWIAYQQLIILQTWRLHLF